MPGHSQKFEFIKVCPVCSSPLLKAYKKGTFNASKLDQDQVKITDSQYGKVWDLSRCEGCGHIFANPCPSSEFIFSLYSAVKDPLYEEEAPGRSRNFLRILDFIEKSVPERGVLFDVGAATGILLDLARRRGWTPEGVEASSWAVQTARAKYGLTLFEGDFEKAPLKENFYTAVTMIDFIEHIPQPLPALLKAHSILKPGGVLSLVTPDIHSLAAKIAGQRWWHFRPAHLSYFSEKSLSTLLGKAWFRIFKKRMYTWTFSAHYLISRKQKLEFLLRSPVLASFFRKIPIKLALCDSFEIYARKEEANRS